MDQERIINRALELVRDGLRDGGIPEDGFNMAHWKLPSCGSPTCIGGWTEGLLLAAGWPELAGFVKAAMKNDHPLHRLFLPINYSMEEWRELSREESARAIDRYLNGAKEPWPRWAS